MKAALFVVLTAFTATLLIAPSNAGIFDSDCGNNKTHNFYYGRRGVHDRLFYSTHLIKDYSLLRKSTYDLDFPPKGQPPKGMITYIEVLDQTHDGNGGCSYIKTGGVGHKNVTLHLKSKRNYGLDFLINIYGY